jgi:chemotaxis protein MotB
MSKQQPIIIKKKKVMGHGHHGGSWKVAYADFVTAMMAFFMVMWIMGLSQDDREVIAGYFNDPLGFFKNTPRNKFNLQLQTGKEGKPTNMSLPPANDYAAKKEEDAAEAMKRQIEKAIKGDGDGKGGDAPAIKALARYVDIELTQEGLLVEFSENTGVVFFESGSAVVRPAAQALIAKIAPVLAKSKRKMRIQGHTDSEPYGRSGYDNWDLSNDRAQALRRILMKNGVNSKQILELAGYADTVLKVPNDPYNFANRRVTILLPYTSSAGEAPAMPKEALSADIEAMFKKPRGGIERPGISPKKY